MAEPIDKTAEYERLLGESKTAKYLLRLYVSGTTPRSLQAIESVRAICDEHLAGRYEIQVIDVYQKPELARGRQILAAPTLVKELPPPVRKLIGDLTDVERVLKGLDIELKK
jgi:circadian clock protein KaiB